MIVCDIFGNCNHMIFDVFYIADNKVLYHLWLIILVLQKRLLEYIAQVNNL